MEAAKKRSAVFFVQYGALLCAALVWVNTAPVRERADGHVVQFYWLIGAAFCYLGVRAALVLATRVRERANYLWDAADLGIISGAVYLTGGINSEAALVYFWPIITSSVQRLPRRTAAVGLASGLLYVAATWSSRADPKYATALIFRVLLLAMVTWLAAHYAKTEQALIEELTRLREQVALSEYRQRLSQEMHDGIQHYLADIAVRLELARRLVASAPAEAARRAVDQRFAVRQAAAELRHLIRLLRSPVVEREGFVEAVARHLAAFAERAAVAAPLEIDGDVRPLPADVAQTAFRILQEAVMNAEKHARASEVRVTLCFGTDRFACIVRDNGTGFDRAALPEAEGAASGFGLLSMAQRAQSVAGTVEISSAPGAGTAVTFTVPFGEG